MTLKVLLNLLDDQGQEINTRTFHDSRFALPERRSSYSSLLMMIILLNGKPEIVAVNIHCDNSLITSEQAKYSSCSDPSGNQEVDSINFSAPTQSPTQRSNKRKDGLGER
jgi:hypothetical protein